MDQKFPLLLLICIVAALGAGCTTHTPSDGASRETGTLPPVAVSSPAVSLPATPGCTRDEECVPSTCCHPTRCTNAANRGACNEMCTMNCAGPLDCGAGSCGCVRGTCSIVPASASGTTATAIRIVPSPRGYSPMMSSTPGIRLNITATGFTAADAIFSWNTTYGEFLSWNSPDYLVRRQTDAVQNHGEDLYWSFTDKPASNATPVTISVTARDPGSGTLLGTSQLILAWVGDYAVTVQDIR
jgi:hypothetical protein